MQGQGLDHEDAQSGAKSKVKYFYGIFLDYFPPFLQA